MKHILNLVCPVIWIRDWMLWQDVLLHGQSWVSQAWTTPQRRRLGKCPLMVSHGTCLPSQHSCSINRSPLSILSITSIISDSPDNHHLHNSLSKDECRRPSVRHAKGRCHEVYCPGQGPRLATIAWMPTQDWLTWQRIALPMSRSVMIASSKHLRRSTVATHPMNHMKLVTRWSRLRWVTSLRTMEIFWKGSSLLFPKTT